MCFAGQWTLARLLIRQLHAVISEDGGSQQVSNIQIPAAGSSAWLMAVNWGAVPSQPLSAASSSVHRNATSPEELMALEFLFRIFKWTTRVSRWKSRVVMLPNLSSLAPEGCPPIPPNTTKLASRRLSVSSGGCSNVVIYTYHNIAGLVQERRNSSALAMELRLSCTNPSIYRHRIKVETMPLALSSLSIAYRTFVSIKLMLIV